MTLLTCLTGVNGVGAGFKGLEIDDVDVQSNACLSKNHCSGLSDRLPLLEKSAFTEGQQTKQKTKRRRARYSLIPAMLLPDIFILECVITECLQEKNWCQMESRDFHADIDNRCRIYVAIAHQNTTATDLDTSRLPTTT